MQWYIASFIAHRGVTDVRTVTVLSRRYWCILLADSTDLAYDRFLGLAGQTVRTLADQEGGGWSLSGISELLRVPEPPSEGSELMWVEQEYDPGGLENYIKKKEQLRVFASPQCSGSNWYVCDLVLVEVHETGSHGNSRLVWTNSHLIRAFDAESAYNSAIDLGNKQASESGTHRCDGDTSHWEFAGLRDLIQTIDEPRDGGTLWFEELDVSSEQLRNMVPPRMNLGAFEWEARSGTAR